MVLETQRMKNVLYLENALGDELGVLFLEDKEEELCSFKAVRLVHEVNRHKKRSADSSIQKRRMDVLRASK